MRPLRYFFLILILAIMACGSAVPATSVSTSVVDPNLLSTDTPAPVSTNPVVENVTVTTTPNPANVIHVDTLQQEVYPFIENGKCSLGEAIYAANSETPNRRPA